MPAWRKSFRAADVVCGATPTEYSRRTRVRKRCVPTTSTSSTPRMRSQSAGEVPSASAPSKSLLEALWAPLKNTACILSSVTTGVKWGVEFSAFVSGHPVDGEAVLEVRGLGEVTARLDVMVPGRHNVLAPLPKASRARRTTHRHRAERRRAARDRQRRVRRPRGQAFRWQRDCRRRRVPCRAPGRRAERRRDAAAGARRRNPPDAHHQLTSLGGRGRPLLRAPALSA